MKRRKKMLDLWVSENKKRRSNWNEVENEERKMLRVTCLGKRGKIKEEWCDKWWDHGLSLLSYGVCMREQCFYKKCCVGLMVEK